MLAAVYHGSHDVRVEDYPRPEAAPGGVLLRVIAAGICATDLRIVQGGHRAYPDGTVRIPGHEVVGEVVEVGTGAVGVAVGQCLFVAPNMGCGHCRQCVSGQNNRCPTYTAFGINIDGAFAEYMAVPAAACLQGNLIPLAPDADAATSTLIEPLACVLRGQEAAAVGAGDFVVIVGAGPIGTMHLLLARLRGAGRVLVADLLPHRRRQAAEAGADRVLDPAQEDLAAVVAAETRGAGADVVIVAAPAHRAMQEAPGLAAQGGRVLFFAGLPKDRPEVTVDANVVHYKELRVTGTTGCSTADCWHAAAIVNAGRIRLDALVSARFPLARAAEALALAEDRHSLKVVIEP
ncbi:MAG: alcohol dehydrogenase catalytic domain-containing protein [Anaerolineae bacterium]